MTEEVASVGKKKLRRTVFLDRDGVLNRALERDGKPVAPLSLAEFELLPRISEACARLRNAGFLLIVATNQPDARLLQQVPLDRIEVCYHAGLDENECNCRKPKPGMLLRAAKDLGIDLPDSFMVGDRWKDIDCGAAAGCRTILIDYGYAEKLHQPPDFRVRDLSGAADWILLQPSVRRAVEWIGKSSD